MKNFIVFCSIALAGGLLFVNLYTSMVDAKSWGSNLPASIATAREYFKAANPGDFFRIFSPLNQVIALLALILFWKKAPGVRPYLGAALIIYVLCDVMTFAYFYPRNDIMFHTASLTDTELLKRTWAQWSSMNWVRSLALIPGLVCSFTALHKIYGLQQGGQASKSFKRKAETVLA